MVELASAAEGDVVQGMVFTMICLIIVIGIYLLVFTEYRPGEGVYAADLDGARARAWPSRLRVPGSFPQAPEQHAKLAGAHPDYLRAVRTAQAPAGARPSFGVPGTPGTPSPTLPGTQVTIVPGSAHAPGAHAPGPRTDEWHEELPMIYPKLVMPMAHTRLAVPLATLSKPSFEVDVLGLSGVPLLSAALVERGGARNIDILLHAVNTQLALVTQEMEIFGPDGVHFGSLQRDSSSPQFFSGEGPSMVLRDRGGRPILLLITTRRDASGRDFKISSVVSGRLVERATAVRRPAGRLPAEHYEVVANPSVDAVLVLAVLLGAVVFDAQQPRFNTSPGRPSSMPMPGNSAAAGSRPGESLLGLAGSNGYAPPSAP